MVTLAPRTKGNIHGPAALSLVWTSHRCPPSLRSPSIRAGDNSTGAYQCATLVVNGRSGRCSSPQVVLYPDGTCKIWVEQSTYKIGGRGNWLSSPSRKSAGRVGCCGAGRSS